MRVLSLSAAFILFHFAWRTSRPWSVFLFEAGLGEELSNEFTKQYEECAASDFGRHAESCVERGCVICVSSRHYAFEPVSNVVNQYSRIVREFADLS